MKYELIKNFRKDDAIARTGHFLRNASAIESSLQSPGDEIIKKPRL